MVVTLRQFGYMWVRIDMCHDAIQTDDAISEAHFFRPNSFVSVVNLFYSSNPC